MSDEQAETLGEDQRDVRLGRIVDDYLSALSRGEAPSESEIIVQHPELSEDLHRLLSAVRDLRPASDEIEALISRGVLERSDDPAHVARFGTFKVTGLVGCGGMGIVLKGHEESLNRDVALKILRPELATDPKALARFTREAKAAGCLRHPNIVTVHAVGAERGAHFIAMEYVDGPSLAAVIQDQGPMPADTIRTILQQLLSGLAAAHDAGLIHRDIKSSNILLDGCLTGVNGHTVISPPATPETENEPAEKTPATSPATERTDRRVATPSSGPQLVVKIADFGLARMLTSQTRVTLGDSVLGTPEYMSPEQARGDESIDQRTDLYSAGVVLYEMLTGRTPFRADASTATIHRILHDDPPTPQSITKDVDPHLATLALRLMAKSPADRFSSTTEAIRALEEHGPIHSPERRRRLGRRLLAATAPLAVILVATWGTWQLVGHQPEIAAVRIDPTSCRAIEARRDVGAPWKPFYEFSSDLEIIITDPVCVDVDGRGEQLVVVGVRGKLDDHGNALVAFDTDGLERWRVPLNDGLARLSWPARIPIPPKERWYVTHILHANLDRVSGDELIVVAKDPQEYPARISIIDPRTGAIRHTFWHMGHVHKVWMVEGFFPDGVGGHRPALLVWATNCKLDGFSDGLRAGEQRFARWDDVNVLMLLDPEAMDGVGPPPFDSSRLPGTQTALPYAYAVLDLAYNEQTRHVPEGGCEPGEAPRWPNTYEIGKISDVSDSYCAADNDAPWFRVEITQCIVNGQDVGRPGFSVDRHLNRRRLDPSAIPPETRGLPENHWEGYWKEHWRPIIQNGVYLDK